MLAFGFISFGHPEDMSKQPDRADCEWLQDFESAQHGEIRLICKYCIEFGGKING